MYNKKKNLLYLMIAAHLKNTGPCVPAPLLTTVLKHLEVGNQLLDMLESIVVPFLSNCSSFLTLLYFS